ncbi:substrate-binding domain-containing protein [Saccharothrix sp. S26]|uniref:substrate-binding domain-containing protein n=1 Tax=Saccharothrix sp. S26 TaxID=2907215 RepID=UPI001F17392E|nr:substrate-binding domain-containing protein [Saccharothrix sp. S26]MCE6993324.1 substrate-binding domain-containing protein [Saccharothrix sp. S26]
MSGLEILARTCRVSRPRTDRPRPPAPLVEMVFPALNSAWAMEVMRGVVDSGLDVVLSSAAGRGTSWAVDVVRARRAGVLLVTCPISVAEERVFARAGVPLVHIDPVDAAAPDLLSVGATNRAGGVTAVKHLLSLGHRRIAVVGGPPDVLCSRARVDGYRFALRRAGLPFDTALVRHADFTREGGRREAAELLRLSHRPTAIFAANDDQALGVLEAARAAGLSTPRDLSVVGFDDLPAARRATPALTTIRQPLAAMGEQAGRMLTDLIAGHLPPTDRVELATTLVIRTSTAPPPLA